MRKLIIVRGLPGSGKSTFTQKYKGNNTKFVFEADQYFYNKDGVYEFDASKLNEAHTLCQYNTSLMLRSYKSVDVIVSNTFSTIKELDYYMNLDYDSVTIVEMKSQYTSVHNVPEKSIDRMKARWVSKEDILNFYKDINITYIKG